ncbi:MAG: hypothetical protein IPM20_06390 [Gammaproteobacteria bacterium]|nr:hypothetical protein [Gammaproteobacteria bacterium]
MTIKTDIVVVLLKILSDLILGNDKNFHKKLKDHLIIRDDEGEPLAVVLEPSEYYLLKATADLAKDTAHFSYLVNKNKLFQDTGKTDGISPDEFLKRIRHGRENKHK